MEQVADVLIDEACRRQTLDATQCCPPTLAFLVNQDLVVHLGVLICRHTCRPLLKDRRKEAQQAGSTPGLASGGVSVCKSCGCPIAMDGSVQQSTAQLCASVT